MRLESLQAAEKKLLLNTYERNPDPLRQRT